MPKGIPNKKRVVEVARPAVVAEAVVAPVAVQDASAALYKDRCGPRLGNGLTEGRDNFAAVTAEARKVLTDA